MNMTEQVSWKEDVDSFEGMLRSNRSVSYGKFVFIFLRILTLIPIVALPKTSHIIQASVFFLSCF